MTPYTYYGTEYTRTAFAFDFDNADNYDHNYQYDGSAGTYSVSTPNLTAAAVYTINGEAGSRQSVSAVGVGFASASTSYTVKIYTDLKNANNPESGTLAITKKGKTSFEGYYTIELDDIIMVDAGEKIGVVVTASKGSAKAGIFVDASYTNGGWIGFTADTDNDKTFYKSGNNWVNAGTTQNYTFRIKAFTNDIDTSAQAADKVIVDDMIGTINPVEYSGVAATPEPKVVFDGVTLTKGTDYTLSYENNNAAGTAKVIIKGTGSYTGEVTKEFKINQKTITKDMISVSGWTFDGTTHDNILTVKNGNVVMTQDTDYTVKYNKTPLNAGKYTVTVTGKGSYKGKAAQTFTVDKYALTENVISLDNTSYVYSGAKNTPKVTVKIGEYEVPSANFKVSYANNVVAGTATVTIKGKGNCEGTVSKTFEIAKKSIDAETITATVKDSVYLGTEVKPAVTVKDGNKKLALNKDYELQYSQNVNATEAAKVTIKGIGNYSGSKELTFKITPRTVKANNIKVEANYNGENSECAVIVDKMTLNASDYTITGVKDSATGAAVEVAAMQPGSKYDISVELKNNYSGAADRKSVV